MTTQDISHIRSSPSAIGASSARSKRARTKHACDECRRSQKKCDGDKPLCRRCYLNGTQCTYTPHKSRSQCACTGQAADDARRTAPVPDVFIFPDATNGSFHTWSTSSSPNQSPTTSGSGLDEPSPMYHTHDDSPRSAVLEMPGSTSFSYAATASQMQLKQQSPSPFQRNTHLYSQRSQSVPSFFPGTSPPTSSRTTSYSPAYPSSSRAHYTLQEAHPLLETASFPQSEVYTGAIQHLDTSPAHNGLLLSHYVQLEDGSASIFDFTPQFNQNVEVAHTQSSYFGEETSVSATQQAYDVQQYPYQQPATGNYEAPSGVSSNSMAFQPGSSPNAFAQHPSSLERPSTVVPTQPQPQAQALPLLPAHAPHQSSVSHYEYFEQPLQAQRGEHVDYARTQLHAASQIGSATAGVRASHNMRLSLPAAHFSPQQWRNELVGSPPASLSPGSSYSSPAAYGNFDFCDWSR